MKFLVDTDYLFGIAVSDDPHHEQAKRIADRVRADSLYITNVVYYEIATVLSYKANQQVAKEFIQKVKNGVISIVRVEGVLEEKAWDVFMKQTKKGISFVDCANLAVIEYYNLDGILSFDGFYPARLGKT